MSQYSKGTGWAALRLFCSIVLLLLSGNVVVADDNAAQSQADDGSGTPQELLDEEGFLNLEDLGVELPVDPGASGFDSSMPGAAPSAPILTFKQSVYGGRELVRGAALPRWLVGSNQLKLMRPVAVSVKPDGMYVLDTVGRAVFRYDFERRSMEMVVDTSERFRGEPSGLAVGRDGDIYIADPTGKKVLSFTSDGKFRHIYQDRMNLARPVDVMVNDEAEQVYIVDSGFARVVVFKKDGMALYTIGDKGDGLGYFTNPSSFTMRNDNLYVTDSMGIPLQVFPSQGNTYAVGDNELTDPGAVAVDNYGRVYVADNHDYYVNIYYDGVLLERFDGGSRRPLAFRDIADLWIEGDTLYVADMIHQRIQVFNISPP